MSGAEVKPPAATAQLRDFMTQGNAMANMQKSLLVGNAPLGAMSYSANALGVGK